jgi:hypothetical protein
LDVVGYGVVKENRLLANHSEAGPKVMKVIVPYVDPVNKNFSFFWLVESLQQLENSRFTAARRSHEANFFSLFDA